MSKCFIYQSRNYFYTDYFSRDNNRNQRQHAPPPPEVIHNVKKLFNKSFVIPSNDWSLPPSQSWWKSDHFQVRIELRFNKSDYFVPVLEFVPYLLY